MKLYLIGAALCVAPIFSSTQPNLSDESMRAQLVGWLNHLAIVSPVHAQQADLILELQALRAEIGELRDMIERQQFEMRRMKKTVDSLSAQSATRYSPPVSTAPGVNQPNSVTYQSAPSYSQDDQTAPNYADAGNQSGVVGSQSYGDEPAVVLSNDEQDFYRPYGTGSESRPTGPAGVSTAAEYDQQQLEAARAARSGQPPVVDRSVRVVPNRTNQVPVQVNRPNSEGTATQLPNQPPVTVLEQGSGGNVPLSGEQPISQAAVPTDVSATNSPEQVSQQTPNAANPIVPTPTASAEPIVVSEQDYYQRGFELLKQSKHSQAVEVFKRQISQYPTGDFSDDAHYWIAESMYVNRSLDQSKLYFKAIIDRFAQSPRLPDAMLKTAYIEQEQGNQIEARILLQEIIQYHPRSNAAISAKNRLAELNG